MMSRSITNTHLLVTTKASDNDIHKVLALNCNITQGIIYHSLAKEGPTTFVHPPPILPQFPAKV